MRLAAGPCPLLSVGFFVSVVLILASSLPHAGASAGYSKTVFLQDLASAFHKLLEARGKALPSGLQTIQLLPVERKALANAILGLPSLHTRQVEEELCRNYWGASQWYDLLQTLISIKQESDSALTLSSNQLIATTAIIGAMMERLWNLPEGYMPQLVQAGQKSPLEWLNDLHRSWTQSFDAEAISQLITKEQQRSQVSHDQDGDVVMQDADMELEDTYMAAAETLEHFQLPDLIKLEKRQLTNDARGVMAYLGDAFEKLLSLRYAGGGEEKTFVATKRHFDALLLAMAAIPRLYCQEASQQLAQRYWEGRQWAHWLTAVTKLQQQRVQGSQEECKVTLKLEEIGAINNLLDIYFGWLQGANQEDLNSWFEASYASTAESLLQQLVTNWGVDGETIRRILKLEGTEEGRLELSREGLQDVMMEDVLELPDYPRIEDVYLEAAWTRVPEVPAPPLTEVIQPPPSQSSVQAGSEETPPSTAGPIVTYSGVQELATAVNVPAEQTYHVIMGVWKSMLHVCSRTGALLKELVTGTSESGTLLLSQKKAGHLTSLLLLMPTQRDVLLKAYTGTQLSDIVVRMTYALASLGHAVRQQKDGIIGGVQLPMSKAQAAALGSYLTLMETVLQAGPIEEHVRSLLVVKHNMVDWKRRVRESFGVSESLRRAMFKEILKEHGQEGPLRKARNRKKEEKEKEKEKEKRKKGQERQARQQKLKQQRQERKVALLKRQNESLRYQLGLVCALNELLRMIKGAQPGDITIPIKAKRQWHYFVDLMRVLPVVLPSLREGSSSNESLVAFATFVKVAQSQAIRARKKGKPPAKVLPATTMRAMLGLLEGFLAFVSDSDPLYLYTLAMMKTTRQVLNVLDVLIARADGSGGPLNVPPEQLQAAMAALENPELAASALKQIKGTDVGEEVIVGLTAASVSSLNEALVTQAQSLVTQMTPSKAPLSSVSEEVSAGAVEALKHTQPGVDEEGSVDILAGLVEDFAKLSLGEAEEKQEQLKQLTIASVSSLVQETANEAVREKVSHLIELEPTTDVPNVIPSASVEGDRVNQAEIEAKSLSIISGQEVLAPAVDQGREHGGDEGDEDATLPATFTQAPVLEDMAKEVVSQDTAQSLPQVKSQLAEQLATILAKVTYPQTGEDLEWSVLDEEEMKILRSLLNNETLEEQGVSEQDLSIVRRLIEAYDRSKRLEREQEEHERKRREAEAEIEAQRSREEQDQSKKAASTLQPALESESVVVTFTPIEVSNALKRVVSCAAGASCYNRAQPLLCDTVSCKLLAWTDKPGNYQKLDLTDLESVQRERNLFMQIASSLAASAA